MFIRRARGGEAAVRGQDGGGAVARPRNARVAGGDMGLGSLLVFGFAVVGIWFVWPRA